MDGIVKEGHLAGGENMRCLFLWDEHDHPSELFRERLKLARCLLESGF